MFPLNTWRLRAQPLALFSALFAFAALAEPDSHNFPQAVIAFVHTPPARAGPGTDLVIEGEMFGASELQSAQVLYRAGDGRLKAAPLLPASGFAWRAVLPASTLLPPSIDYWVEAIDGQGQRHLAFASDADPTRVKIGGGPGVSGDDHLGLVERTPQQQEVVIPSSPDKPPGDMVGTHTIRALPLTSDRPTQPESRPTAPGEDKTAAVPGPTGAPQPAKKSRRAPPGELSLFSPEDPATLSNGTDTPPLDAPGISTVLGEDLLKSLGVRTVAEALKFVPGLFITTDALGFNQASARGLRDDAGILLLYDGLPLNAAVDGRALLELPTENLERIEVLRGPESSRFGNNALLAVINLVPRRKDGVAAAASADSSRAGAVDFHGGGQIGKLQIDGDVDVRGASPTGPAINRDALTGTLRSQGLLGANSPAGNLDDSGLLLNAGARVFYSGFLTGEIELKLRAVHEKRGVHLGIGSAVGGEPTAGGADDSAIERDLLLADLAWTRSLGPVQLAVRGHAGEHDEARAYELAPPGISLAGQKYPQGLHQRLEWQQHSLGVEAGVRFDAASLGLRGEARFGFQRDYLGKYLLSADASNTGAPQGGVAQTPVLLGETLPGLSGRSDLFAQVQLEWRPNPIFSLLLGLRADEIPGASAADCGGTACIDPSLTARPDLGLVSPNAAIVAHPGAGFALKLLAGRAFRAPTLDELAARPVLPASLLVDQLRGAEALAPEQSDSLALATEWAGPLADGRAHFRAVGSLTDLSPAILAAQAGDHLDSVNSPVSIRAASLELEGRLESSRRSWQMASFTWNRARDLNVRQSAWTLRDLPQLRAVLAAAVPLGDWLNVILWIEGTGARQNNQRTPLEAACAYQIPASALVSATLRTEPFFGRLELALTLRDLLGAATPDDTTRPDLLPGLLPNAGFSASLTARARF